MYFKLCFYIASTTNVFLSSILDILRERGIPHQISPSTYHPWCYSVVSPVLRSSRIYYYHISSDSILLYNISWGLFGTSIFFFACFKRFCTKMGSLQHNNLTKISLTLSVKEVFLARFSRYRLTNLLHDSKYSSERF